MAQTGYTPILIYSSSTVSQAPAAGNLTNSTLGSELAINITDGKLFYKDNANAVQVIGWKTTPTTAGGTGLTSYTAGDLLYYATGTTLSKLAIGASKTILTSSGTAPQWSTSLDTTQGGTGLTTYTAGDLPYYATGTALSKLGIGAANTVLTSSGSAPQWTAQSGLSVGTAANLKSNATTGVMQIVGPTAAATRVMTIPDANFTAARTDAAQTFTGDQTINGILNVTYGTGDQLLINAKTNDSTAANNAGIGLRANSSATAGSRFAQLWFDADGANLSGGDYFLMTKNGNNGTIDLIQYSNSAMRFAANYIGRATIDMTLFPSGGVSIGNTTDPGATNLSVTGNILGGSGKSFIANGNRTYYSAAGFWDDTVQGNACGVGCFGGPAIGPLNGAGAATDNTIDLGSGTYRWKTVFAGTATINTSDANEKQDIEFLDNAELAVAKQIKLLIKKFKFKDAVKQKGNDARVHFGVLAQEIESAFAAQNLDASKYGLFCRDEWYEIDGKAIDENMKPYTANTNLAVKKTRLGVRYEELFAFVIAAM